MVYITQIFKHSTDGHYHISGLPDDGDGVGPRNDVYFKSFERLEARERFIVYNAISNVKSFVILRQYFPKYVCRTHYYYYYYFFFFFLNSHN